MPDEPTMTAEEIAQALADFRSTSAEAALAVDRIARALADVAARFVAWWESLDHAEIAEGLRRAAREWEADAERETDVDARRFVFQKAIDARRTADVLDPPAPEVTAQVVFEAETEVGS